MDRATKAKVIEQVAGQIEESEAIYAVDYRGLTVAQAADLRGRLRDADATFSIVKNTLGELAADRAGAAELKSVLVGPTALAFVRGDVAAAAKALQDAGRTTGVLAFKGGFMGGRALSADEIVAIAKLPSREQLIAQLVGGIAAPLTGLARTLNELIAGLARSLQQVADQGLVGGDAPAPAAEAAEPQAAAPDADSAGTPSDESGQPAPSTDVPDPDSEPKDLPEPGPDPDPAPAE